MKVNMKVKIIYGTQSGTTQYVAGVIQKHLVSLGHQVDLHNLKRDGGNPDLSGYDSVLFGSPTYDEGQLEATMKMYVSASSPDLSSYKVAIFGLGNSFYPQFCVSVKLLEEWATKNKGVPAIPSLKIDGFPDNVTQIKSWAEQFSNLQ
jgi:flavodoxin I